LSAPLNLARCPFRNERAPTLLLSVGLGALLVARDTRPGGARDVEGQVAALERETAALRSEAEDLEQLKAPKESLEKWKAVKQLVDRRAFSWTGLFAALEAALPPSVRLLSVAPAGGEEPLALQLSAVGRDRNSAYALLESLQAHPAFEGAFLEGVKDAKDGVEISCTVHYRTARASVPAKGGAAPRALAAGEGPASPGGPAAVVAGGRP
jgi:Tfp pilus assembly protein PilN